MNRTYRYILLILVIAVLAGVIICYTAYGKESIENYKDIVRFVRISPDYTDTVIPPNVAPLNFVVKEHGSRYLVKIYSANGEPIEVFSRTGKIIIPQQLWKRLLSINKGNDLFFDIYIKDNEGKWGRYKTITNTIAKDQIDSHIAYRRMKPIYNFWQDIGIYQRDLESYNESVILHGKSFKGGCLNCHSFLQNNPEKMFLGIRSAYGNSVIFANNESASKIGTKFGYTAWHPSGRLAAYSINNVTQFIHTARSEVREVIDLDSALAYYVVDSQKAKTTPAISDKGFLETYPAWSPDGRYLYFCKAPILWSNRKKVPPAHYDENKYDLVRISYDLESDQWGEVETILSSKTTGLSILLPRISPDGRFLLFCMCEFGCFPIHQASSDLYLMELETGVYHKLSINSEYSESWHSWSSNSRWIAFSSRRSGGLFTRSYLAYIDEEGKSYKAFVLPQKDPTFYDSFLETYSVPELITGPVKVNKNLLAQTVRNPKQIEVDMPLTGASPMAGGSDPWKQGHK